MVRFGKNKTDEIGMLINRPSFSGFRIDLNDLTDETSET